MKKTLSLSSLKPMQLNRALAVLLFAVLMLAAGLLFVPQAQATAGYHLYSWGEEGALGRPVTPANPANRPGRVDGTWIHAAGTRVQTGVATANASFAISSSGHLYAWGLPENAPVMGQGLPAPTTWPAVHQGTGERITSPRRIGTANNWTMVSAHGSDVAALNSNGEIYVWGTGALDDHATSRPSMQNNTDYIITAPRKIQGIPDDWVYIVVGRGSGTTGEMGAGFILALNEDGFLYSWGDKRFSEDHLFTGGSSVHRPLGRPGPHFPPARVLVEGSPDTRWRSVSAYYAGAAGAITQDGELFTWGRACPVTMARNPCWLPIPPNPYNVTGFNSARPGQVEGVTNGAKIRSGGHGGAILKSTGEIYTWGSQSSGWQYVLGRPFGANHPHNVPAMRPAVILDANGDVRSDFVLVFGGHTNRHAIDEDGNLWSWGFNGQGQLGLGDYLNRNRPTLLGRVERFSDGARTSWQHTLMLVEFSTVTGSSYLTKDLRKPYGTPIPGLTFSFTMEARSFNGGSEANFTTNFPNVTIDGTTQSSANITRTIPIGTTSTSTPASPQAGDIVTLSAATDLLAGINFTQAGIYSWTITEVQTATGVGANSSVHFSQAQYELRVYVQPGAQQFDPLVVTPTVHRLREADGTVLTDSIKVPYLVFTNDYTRTTTGTGSCDGGLVISKTVDGNFFSIDTQFMFGITLTATGLCDPEDYIVGSVYAGTTFVRYENFESGVERDIPLLDGQRIVFPTLTVGSQFTAVERAIAGFTASVVLYVNGAPVVVNPNQAPNLPLSIGGPHLVRADVRNSAAFTNLHHYTPPTGLFLSNGSYAFIVAAGLMFAVLLAVKARKRIEELPIMH